MCRRSNMSREDRRAGGTTGSRVSRAQPGHAADLRAQKCACSGRRLTCFLRMISASDSARCLKDLPSSLRLPLLASAAFFCAFSRACTAGRAGSLSCLARVVGAETRGREGGRETCLVPLVAPCASPEGSALPARERREHARAMLAWSRRCTRGQPCSREIAQLVAPLPLRPLAPRRPLECPERAESATERTYRAARLSHSRSLASLSACSPTDDLLPNKPARLPAPAGLLR